MSMIERLDEVKINLDRYRYNDLIQVGTPCRAKRTTGVCDKGEIGVCYEVYRPSPADPELKSFSFIFKNGGYDGFSSQDIDLILLLEPRVIQSIADYEFKNVTILNQDHRAGVFDAAWSNRG